MKILYLTGGAGRMYCGSCLRDNALARELLSRGHEVMLLPIYTPTLTDEPNVSGDQVFFGGVSVYLQQYLPPFRKTPQWLDRVLDSKALLHLATRFSISTNPKMLGEMTVSMLKGENGHQQKEIEKLINWVRGEEPPDIISLPYTLMIGLAQPLRRKLQRPICCTLQGEDLFLQNLQEPYRGEALKLIRSQVKNVDLFIAVSYFCAEYMSDYLQIPSEKIRVVPLGINQDGFDRGSETERPFTIGYFARVAPEKGLHVLAEAFRLLRKRVDDARLEVAGYLAPEHRRYLKDITARINSWNLADAFAYRGTMEREGKIRFLQSLDVLSVPATYNEPKGIFLLEAMACGVPVVQPRRGGFIEIVEQTEGGLLIAPDDPQALADGLFKLYEERDLCRRLAANALKGVRQHYTVSLMADNALGVYDELLASESVRDQTAAATALV